MSIKYYAVSIEKSSTNREPTIVIKDEIQKDEFENLFSIVAFLKDIMPAKEAHRIVMRNGRTIVLSFR